MPFNKVVFAVIFIFKLQKNEFQVIKCVVGVGIYTLKMAGTDDYSEKDMPLNKFY